MQEVIKAKKDAMKMRNTTKARVHRCRQAKKAAKTAVSSAKALTMNELDEELNTREDERKILRIAKARDKPTNDFTNEFEFTTLLTFPNIMRLWTIIYLTTVRVPFSKQITSTIQNKSHPQRNVPAILTKKIACVCYII